MNESNKHERKIVGSSLRHSETPNFKCIPFLYGPTNVSFSLIWPVSEISAGDVITRNFYPAGKRKQTRQNSKT